MAHCTTITELGDSFKFYRSSLGCLDALVGPWLVAVNSCDDGLLTCMLTVHPLNVALLKRPRVLQSLQSWFECNLSLVCLQIVNNSD